MTTGNWSPLDLGEVAPLSYGRALPTATRSAGNVPVYSSAGQTGTHDEALVKGPAVIVGRKGNVGSVYYSERDFYPIDTAFFTRGSSTADTKFLYYKLQSLGLSTLSRDSAVPGLQRDEYNRIRSLFPPKSEQQAIAEVLGALDDKIAANIALTIVADDYAAALLRGSLTAQQVRLDSIAQITMGSSPKGDTLNESGEGVPFYQGVRDFGFRSPRRRVFTTSPTRSADSGDILVSVRAPVGDVNVANEPICIGRGVAAVRSSVGAQSTLFHQLKTERAAWAPFEAEGTVFGSINRDQLHGIFVRTVTEGLVAPVERMLVSIEASIASTLAENDTLAATRDALLPQLMSGKLRVGNAETIASAAGA